MSVLQGSMQGQPMTAGTGQLGQDIRDRAIGTGQSGQNSWRRRTAIVAGHHYRKEMTGLPKHNRTGQLGQDN
jgi:hypothetical protein